MIYVDTSVVLAHLFSEDVRPPDSLWHQPLISSRLMQYETMTRLNAQRGDEKNSRLAQDIFSRIGIVEMIPLVLKRTFDPFPVQMRTLDALHLSTLLYLVAQGQQCELASYDVRMNQAAIALKIPLWSF